jgi:hypothetical protein
VGRRIQRHRQVPPAAQQGPCVKRDQILATGAKLVVAPCHNCWDAIRDLEEIYKIGIRWSFLKATAA